MPRVAIAPAAASDIDAILLRSHDRFGEEARLRYEALIVQAILDVSDRPRRSGVQKRPEIGSGVWTYHLHHSSHRVADAIGRVRRPRHLLVFRTAQDGTIEIGRVLHDSMELGRRLPGEESSPPVTGGDSASDP